MIDPHWSLVDLDPHTWRSIGRFFDPGQYIRTAQHGEHGLFVLHDGGRVTRVVDTRQGARRDLRIEAVADPASLADSLFATGEWERVHVIDKQHLANVARKSQSNARRDLTLDQYYRMVYNLMWDGSGGYVSLPAHPGHWHGWTYGDLQTFVAGMPDPASVALVVVGKGRTEIGLIFDISEGLIRAVTTLETFGLPAPGFETTPEDFERLWNMLQTRNNDYQNPGPAAVLLCTAETFEKWMEAADSKGKQQILDEAKARGEALWRIEARS